MECIKCSIPIGTEDYILLKIKYFYDTFDKNKKPYQDIKIYHMQKRLKSMKTYIILLKQCKKTFSNSMSF